MHSIDWSTVCIDSTTRNAQGIRNIQEWLTRHYRSLPYEVLEKMGVISQGYSA